MKGLLLDIETMKHFLQKYVKGSLEGKDRFFYYETENEYIFILCLNWVQLYTRIEKSALKRRGDRSDFLGWAKRTEGYVEDGILDALKSIKEEIKNDKISASRYNYYKR